MLKAKWSQDKFNIIILNKIKIILKLLGKELINKLIILIIIKIQIIKWETAVERE